ADDVLDDASFADVRLEKLSVHGGSLRRVDFSRVLVRATFFRTDLRSAVFTGCSYDKTIFIESKLTGQVFRGQSFENCQFTDADLRDADFEGAT
ncbi:pentapeptide repeat-containing protein, partial [Mycobacterium tuberculosis]